MPQTGGALTEEGQGLGQAWETLAWNSPLDFRVLEVRAWCEAVRCSWLTGGAHC